MKSRRIELYQSGTGRDSADCEYEYGCSVQAIVSGTATYSIQWSNDGGTTWVDHDTISSATASANGAFTVGVDKVAVNVSSGTGNVSVYLKGA